MYLSGCVCTWVVAVRVYCVQDTDHAVRYVTDTEKQFGGRLVDKPVSTLLQDGGNKLCLQLEKLGEGWTVQAGAELQAGVRWGRACGGADQVNHRP